MHISSLARIWFKEKQVDEQKAMSNGPVTSLLRI